MPDTQYFTNIDGKYVKDAEAREQLNDLEDYVESLDQPWQPLQDGYSNFWFELTNDTLSPWLNFSAKNANAVIDWGDGSGEQALTTLTPTHTYSKAGRYVVKVKGVTELARQHQAPFNGKYISVLKAVELNNELTSFQTYSFTNCVGMVNAYISNGTTLNEYLFNCCSMVQKIRLPLTLTNISAASFYMARSLMDINIPQGVTGIGTSAFSYCLSLINITIPDTVTALGNTVFQYCSSLSEIHCQATTPPTLGTNVFFSVASNFIIYVPVGYGDVYKAAWSDYADHILEEGETPTRAMVAKFNAMKTDEPQDDMR